MEKNQNKKKKTAITIILIAVLIAALALIAVACSLTNGGTAEPEETPSPAESAAPSAQPGGKTETSPKPETTAKPAATAAPETTAAPAETGGTNTGTTNTGSTGNQDKEDEHQHSWQAVYTTVHHDEVGHYETVTVQAAWDEEEMVWETICNVCGRRGGDVPFHIMDDHDGNGSYHSEQVPTGNVIHHEAVTEQKWVVDSPAFDEQVVSHYICACGQTRSR